MDEIEEIQKRMEKGETKKAKRSTAYKIMMSFLIVLALALGFLIYARVDENGSVLNNIFHSNISFTSFNAKINRFLDNMFRFNLKDNQDDLPVGGSVTYEASEDQSVRMLKRGVVSYMETKNQESFVMITYENGVVASYYELFDPIVKTLDQLKAGDVIASYETKFKVLFQKGNQLISYEEALL